jgi:hypothetical protein
MNDQAHVLAPAAVAASHQTFVNDDGVGPAQGHLVYRGLHVDEAVDGAHGDSVVHGDDDGASRLPVHDAFHADEFADHCSSSPMLLWAARAIKKAVTTLLRHGF